MNNTKFKQGLSSSQRALTTFQKQMKAVGGMIAGAFAVGSVVQFARTAVLGLDAQRKAEASLLQALYNKEDVTARLIKQASELQKKTLFGDEETIRAQALIAAFVKEEETIKRIIPLVQDMAAAKQMDLASAADLVAKTLGSSTNALSRYGIEVKGSVGSIERLNSLVKGLSSAFKGQAEAMAEADTSLTQLKNKWGDFSEFLASVVIGIGPAVEDSIRAIGVKEISSWDKFLALFNQAKLAEVQAMAYAINSMKPKEWGGGSESMAKWKERQTPQIAQVNSFTELFEYETFNLSNLDGLFSEHLNKAVDFSDQLIGNFNRLNDEWSWDVAIAANDEYANKTDFMFDQIRNSSDKLLRTSLSINEQVSDSFSQLTQQIISFGSSLASSFGYAIGIGEDFGKTLSELGTMIFDALGSIMIAAGIQTGNWPLVAAGLGVTLMGGLAKGLQSRMEARAEMNGNVRFEIEGDKLVGVMGRYNKKDRYR
jgi:hypothetical protein